MTSFFNNEWNIHNHLWQTIIKWFLIYSYKACWTKSYFSVFKLVEQIWKDRSVGKPAIWLDPKLFPCSLFSETVDYAFVGKSFVSFK